MTTFKPNDKVVCINARPQSFGVRSEDVPHVKLPNGFIEKDAVYCVREVVNLRTGDGLFIVGPQVFLYGKPVPWNGLRFRKVERKKQRNEKAASQKLKTPHQQPTTHLLAVPAVEPRTKN